MIDLEIPDLWKHNKSLFISGYPGDKKFHVPDLVTSWVVWCLDAYFVFRTLFSDLLYYFFHLMLWLVGGRGNTRRRFGSVRSRGIGPSDKGWSVSQFTHGPVNIDLYEPFFAKSSSLVDTRSFRNLYEQV